jgi:DNA-binding MarR family transcriptional regulator
MKDLKDQIIQNLLQEENSINELHRKLGVNRNNLTKTYKQMIKDGYLNAEKRDNKIILSIRKTDFDKFFNHFDSIVEFYFDLANRDILALRKYKPLFKNLQNKDRRFQYTFKSEAMKLLDSIAEQINYLFQSSAALTYAETLEIIPKKFKGVITYHNKRCIEAVKLIIAKLVREHREFESIIKDHISWGYGYKLLTQIEKLSQISKNKKTRILN